MAIIAKYKFNSNLYEDYLPVFNTQFTGYTKTDVNNGDGTITRTISHDTLKPTSMRFGSYNGVITNREKSLLEVIECDTSNITDMSNMFRGCSNLTLLNASNFDTSNVTTMSSLFHDCSSLTSLDVTNFNTSKVTVMGGVFYGCKSLTSLDLSSFDTSKVTNMINIFYICSSLTTLDLSNFDTSQVTRMDGMFNGCGGLTTLNISNFNTSKATNMASMFSNCKSLTSLDVSSFDTSNVTDMGYMFNGCKLLTSLNVSNFNTDKVTNMNNIFSNCLSLTSLNVSNFNTSNVTDMTNMFNSCNKLISLDLSSFNTGEVTSMDSVFNNCSSLISLDLSNFNTNKVTKMNNTFYNCPVSDIGLLYATSSTINSLLAQLGASVARNIYYTDAPLDELTVQDNITYKKYELTMATFPYTLNKLPNGVADYIDVVNKVHVQRVGRVTFNGTETERTWIKGEMHSNNPQKDNLSRFYYGGGSGYNDLKTSSSMLSDKLPYANVTADRSEIESVGHMGNAYFNIIIRKDRLVTDDADGFKTWLQSNPITILHELATPIYTPLTEEEIAQLPLSAYEDGYINLSSDQLMPSFEFRMRASNRYQVDMLETGYYYLNAPVGNVRLGTANVDVQQMPCIVKVDNVGTGDSGYRLGLGNEVCESIIELTFGGYLNANDGSVVMSTSDAYTPEHLSLEEYGLTTVFSFTSCEDSVGSGYGNVVVLYNEEKQRIGAYASETMLVNRAILTGAKYFRVAIRTKNSDNPKAKIMNTPITLAKLPSHRIPTTFTQGMKCGTDFGYWEGIKESKPTSFRTVNTSSGWSVVETSSIEGGMGVVLNRIESGNTIIEDEFDVATGKFTKRVGTYTFNGNSQVSLYSHTNDTALYKSFSTNDIVNLKQGGLVIGFYFNKGMGTPQIANDTECWNIFNPSTLYYRFRKDRYSYYGDGVDGVKAYFNANPTTIYYELEVPEISYLNTTLSQVKTVANTGLQCTRNNGYLNAQVKPSHLTYPVPSLVGNRTYTVVHNRKNINGSTKPTTLELGGAQVQLNDASSKTLVKTPSTLAHSNLIFIGGESTVDHVMVLDGDWTNKPIEYFENMMGHDTDAIITIIGNGQIDDVEEQYLW